MMDFLNNPKYEKYWERFRKQCRHKYPATEIALIQRGLDNEPELLDKCSQRNVDMIKAIMAEEGDEAARGAQIPDKKRYNIVYLDVRVAVRVAATASIANVMMDIEVALKNEMKRKGAAIESWDVTCSSIDEGPNGNKNMDR